MDETAQSRREKITYEIKRAVRNINRNIYEWRKEKSDKVNFTMSYTEVQSLTRNWIARCLRSILDPATVDRIFRRGHLMITVDDNNNCISGLTILSTDSYRSHYKDSILIQEILETIDFTKLLYNPSDYELDGLTQRQGALVEISFASLENFKF